MIELQGLTKHFGDPGSSDGDAGWTLVLATGPLPGIGPDLGTVAALPPYWPGNHFERFLLSP